jgi:hypothetical protein
MKYFAVLFIFGLWGCASQNLPVSMPNEKEFEVPSNLANKFEVKEEIVAMPTANMNTPATESVDTQKKQKGLATKGKKEKVAKPEKKIDWPNRWQIAPFFVTGERYQFDITYFGATAGELVLEMLPPKTVVERPVFHIRAIARTASVFSLFYRMNDVAESFMDATGLFSHKFSLKLDESMQQRDVLELYDQRKNVAHYWSKLDHKKKGKHQEQKEIEVKPFTQDGISAFYYIRTLPLELGKKYEFPVLTNGKIRDVRVEVIRREEISTKIGKVSALVLKPEVMLDGVLKTYGDSFVWISDDEQRRILKVDAKIKVGSIVAYLKDYQSGQSDAIATK